MDFTERKERIDDRMLRLERQQARFVQSTIVYMSTLFDIQDTSIAMFKDLQADEQFQLIKEILETDAVKHLTTPEIVQILSTLKCLIMEKQFIDGSKERLKCDAE